MKIDRAELEALSLADLISLGSFLQTNQGGYAEYEDMHMVLTGETDRRVDKVFPGSAAFDYSDPR